MINWCWVWLTTLAPLVCQDVGIKSFLSLAEVPAHSLWPCSIFPVLSYLCVANTHKINNPVVGSNKIPYRTKVRWILPNCQTLFTKHLQFSYYYRYFNVLVKLYFPKLIFLHFFAKLLSYTISPWPYKHKLSNKFKSKSLRISLRKLV